jgi:hypothetical protein
MQRDGGVRFWLKVPFLYNLFQDAIGARTEQMYCQLAESVFKNVDAWVDTKPLRIPYVMIFLQCQK